MGIRMAELLEALSSSSAFSRGLPTAGNLQYTSMAQVFREALLTGSLVPPGGAGQKTHPVKSPLRRCFEYGWLQLSPPLRLRTRLRRRYISDMDMFNVCHWVTLRRAPSPKTVSNTSSTPLHWLAQSMKIARNWNGCESIMI